MQKGVGGAPWLTAPFLFVGLMAPAMLWSAEHIQPSTQSPLAVSINITSQRMTKICPGLLGDLYYAP